jgi:hypothetical protein
MSYLSLACDRVTEKPPPELLALDDPARPSTELVGELERYKHSYLLCYVCGPEGIIVELAEKIGRRVRFAAYPRPRPRSVTCRTTPGHCAARESNRHL